jgi:predicted enzyme related to lactoylglutathione lyase
MAVDQLVWFEVLGKDPGKLRAFYGELFNWKFTMSPMPEMDYGMTDKADTGIGGGVGKAPEGPGWSTFYVQVKDIRASVARAEALGGKLLLPITKIPEGEIAVVADPEGHPVGFATGA